MLKTIDHPKLTIGISRCLLGDAVRYDGKHKRNEMLIAILSQQFIFQPFCPEVAIGLGIPRPPIQLIQTKKAAIHLVEVNNKEKNYTNALQQYANRTAFTDIARLNGFIFKKNSPSCGTHGVKVHNFEGQFLHQEGIGLFADAIKQQHPLLPIADEVQLCNSSFREKFLARVYAYQFDHA